MKKSSIKMSLLLILFLSGFPAALFAQTSQSELQEMDNYKQLNTSRRF